jgi:asparagine synthase (glutamine-hydrolysing)
MNLALLNAIRIKYPDWKYMIDGDGGDENLKDYPIEENPELTIKSVLNNLMLYQEGWGVDSMKHSLTYSGGLSRGYMRSYAPADQLGFKGFSPYTLPNVIEVAEGIPFIEMTGWNHQQLYRLKGEIVSAGVKAITGLDMPTYTKRRFQHGVTDSKTFSHLFPDQDIIYRQAFQAIYENAG